MKVKKNNLWIEGLWNRCERGHFYFARAEWEPFSRLNFAFSSGAKIVKIGHAVLQFWDLKHNEEFLSFNNILSRENEVCCRIAVKGM